MEIAMSDDKPGVLESLGLRCASTYSGLKAVMITARGDRTGIFRSDGEKPDVTNTPTPRFDFLEFEAYAEMSVQFSRGMSLSV